MQDFVNNNKQIIGVKLTAATNPQLATGPQKWVVLGPTGLFQNALKAAIRYDFYCRLSLWNCKMTSTE